METFNSIIEFIQIAANALQCELQKSGDSYLFPVTYLTEGKFQFKKNESELQRIFSILEQMEEINETSIGDAYSYEVLVSDKSTSSLFRTMSSSCITVDDTEQNCYSLSRPSDPFLLFLFYKLKELGNIGEYLDPIHLNHRPGKEYSVNKIETEPLSDDLFTALKLLNPNLYTVNIKSIKSRAREEYFKLANSFYYYVSFNHGIPIIPQKELANLKHGGRIAKIYPHKSNDETVIDNIYEPELVYHYQLAIASEYPTLEYLSYYHILEYFFKSVFLEKKSPPVTEKIKKLSNSEQQINDHSKEIDDPCKPLTFKEQKALELVLTKFIDVSKLLATIKSQDSSLLNHYKQNGMLFSGVDPLDLDGGDNTKILKNLAKRIYNTRNAIVHSKKENQNRYLPFDKDDEVKQDIPLLKAIAEQVIKMTSSTN